MLSNQPIPEVMPAGVLRAPHHLEIAEIPVWPIDDYGDDDMVLIEVAACGVCGSDYRYFVGENPWAQHTLGRFVPNAANIVLGHEYAGTVVAVCSERNRHLLEKRVAPVCSKVCGKCEECLAGRTRLCERTVHLGHGQGWGERAYYPGAYARYAPAWGASCFELDASLTFEEAAMLDILAVCVHVTDRGDVQPGRPVLCMGAGPAGNGIAQAAMARGASFAVLLDRSKRALEIVDRQGVGVAIHIEELAPGNLERLAPHGFGSVFDSVGTTQSLELGLSQLGKAGTLVNLAVHDEAVPINFMKLSAERRVVTSCNFETEDFPTALRWLSEGKFRVKEWLEPVTMEQLPGVFDRVVSGAQKDVFKLVVDPWA